MVTVPLDFRVLCVVPRSYAIRRRSQRPFPGKGLADAERLVLTASVSTRQRQEADFRRDGPAGHSRLVAYHGETRSQ